MILVARALAAWRMVMLVMLAGLMLSPAAAQTFPKFTGLVVDDANVLPPETEAALTAKLEALQKETKRQLVVATIADLQGYPLEEYGYKLGRAWGVGMKDVNNGVILFIAPNEPAGRRGPRIEVGRGLEPILTDALSSVIINQDMIPRLKAGDVAGGVTAGADAIAQQLRAAPEEAQARLDAATKQFDEVHQRSTTARSSSNGGGVPFGIIIWAIILLFVLIPLLRGRKRSGPWGQRYRRDDGGSVLPIVLWGIANEIGRSSGGGGGWGGGSNSSGGSDGSWGGGGFTGGGGGDFGGGGASGSW